MYQAVGCRSGLSGFVSLVGNSCVRQRGNQKREQWPLGLLQDSLLGLHPFFI